ncbi:hypothetical protein BUALT_Bualt10G0099000 [Buddleja alternifolia]|uniref:Uncharacterized protein n=1 Tax=Buddleja alternifolia TaxID=168488 RepID=A0AAV6X8B3_9LAMI|nr:hypothetical protein BUALT_Bualt10G0099000 [Buddleja alternifolia]
MSTEEAKRAAGGTLHQRRSLPYSPYTMALAGLAMVGAGGLWYFTIYNKKKPEATHVAGVSADQPPRK